MIFGILAVFVVVVLVRTLRFTPKPQPPVNEEKVEFDRERAVESLAELIKCKTISYNDKELEDEAEFEKLYALLPRLYPNVFAACSFQKFPERALLFRWPGKSGKDPSVMMAHYDVVPFDDDSWEKPPFEAIIEDTIALRDKYAPSAKISVLSNATQLHRQDVVRALLRVDNNILKIDAVTDSLAQIINKPCCNYSVEQIISQLSQFKGQVIVQTMLLSGEYNGQKFDNTTEEHIAAWLKVIEKIAPKQVMVYTIARDTPCKTLQAASPELLANVAARVRELGIEC